MDQQSHRRDKRAALTRPMMGLSREDNKPSRQSWRDETKVLPKVYNYQLIHEYEGTGFHLADLGLWISTHLIFSAPPGWFLCKQAKQLVNGFLEVVLETPRGCMIKYPYGNEDVHFDVRSRDLGHVAVYSIGPVYPSGFNFSPTSEGRDDRSKFGLSFPK